MKQKSKPIRSLPKFNNPPPPPEPITPITHDKTLLHVLTAIRKHPPPPEEQNMIVENLIKELAYDREDRLKSTQEEYNRSQKNFEVFVRDKEIAQCVLKERATSGQEKSIFTGKH